MLKGHLILLSQAVREKLQAAALALKMSLHMKILSQSGQQCERLLIQFKRLIEGDDLLGNGVSCLWK